MQPFAGASKPSNRTRTTPSFGLIWLGVKVFLCGAHRGLHCGKSRRCDHLERLDEDKGSRREGASARAESLPLKGGGWRHASRVNSTCAPRCRSRAGPRSGRRAGVLSPGRFGACSLTPTLTRFAGRPSGRGPRAGSPLSGGGIGISAPGCARAFDVAAPQRSAPSSSCDHTIGRSGSIVPPSGSIWSCFPGCA